MQIGASAERRKELDLMSVEYYFANDLNLLHNWAIIDRLSDDAHTEKMAECAGNIEAHIQSLEHWKDTALQLSKNNGENARKVMELEAENARMTAELIDARELLNMALENGEQVRWIPVSERLPEEENKSRLVYGDFFDKAVIALGFSSATLPTKEAEEKLLKRISDLVWLVRNLSDALDCVYGKLPAHWRELPFSYHELKRKVKEVMKNE